jgi:hypothetical protein
MIALPVAGVSIVSNFDNAADSLVLQFAAAVSFMPIMMVGTYATLFWTGLLQPPQ